MERKMEVSKDDGSARATHASLHFAADQVRKVVLRNRWSGIVLGYRRVSAQNCPSFPCSAGRSRSQAHWFERAGSYVNIAAFNTTVHSDRFRCAFLRTIGMCPLEPPLYRFDVSFDTRMTTRPKISPINCRRRNPVRRSNNSGVCLREIAYL